MRKTLLRSVSATSRRKACLVVMGRRKPSARMVLLSACLGALALFLAVAGANAALISDESLTLVANGGFTPRKLPRHHYAPIAFKGHAEFHGHHGAPPPALTHLVLNFDREGRLLNKGLPSCRAKEIEGTSPEEARRRCSGAIVGSGHLRAVISIGSLQVPVHGPITLFNGPDEGGHPTVVAHTRLSEPALQTYVIVVPVQRRPGAYRYKATIDVPVIANGAGAITHGDIEINRRYFAQGKERSYISARCRTSILRTRGRFTFANGDLMEGSVEEFCFGLPPR
jgi:hypothetical protein